MSAIDERSRGRYLQCPIGKLLNSQLSGGVGQGIPGQNSSTLSSSQHCPSLVPVFPLRAAHTGAHGAHYSPYSPSRFHIDKRCRHRCSWKCFSIVLILLSVALTAMLAYFAAVSSMKPSIDPSNCILVQDVKSVTHDQMTQDSASTQIPTEEVGNAAPAGAMEPPINFRAPSVNVNV
ncbi:teneurin-a-like [Ctenocephalides felis]|uniref:teneurin-a-like n=1 Tax=Ctenocephalides felis TaxID=7515 RepID=UPI000E6E4D12|nr:teneurin-a-like [Ctenocephalides felis]